MMINNSPRSAPAASSATSKPATAPCSSPSCTASPTPPKRSTLALRDGDPQALNFYLDHGRVHVGDLATTTDDAFNAWAADRAAGLDAIMLAPTRDLVAEAQPARPRPPPQRGGAGCGGAAGRREPGQCRRCDHHPQQRPPTPPHRHRLGQERRPLDDHRIGQTRRPDRST